MPDYDNTNRGILSKNERRSEDWQPEYTGSLNVEGTDFWVNATIRERKDGSCKFFSLSVKRKGEAPKAQPRRVERDDDEEIPF